MKTSGTVKWFDPKKGYGFIRFVVSGPNGPEKKEIFCHCSAILAEKDEDRELKKGQTVEFVVENGKRGEYAAQVRPAKP